MDNPFADKTKFERVALLRKYGLNVPEQTIIKDSDHWRKLLQAFAAEKIMRVSLRTWLPDGHWGTPHHPNVLLTWAAEKVVELLRYGYQVTVTKGIDPVYTCVCGTVYRTNDGSFHFELAHGPGTVRRVMVEGEIDLLIENPYDSDILRTVMNELVLYQLPIDTIYEWSWYHIRIGYKKENLIFWEALPFGENTENI